MGYFFAVREIWYYSPILSTLLAHRSPLADAHPTQFYKTLFPGQDYNDARFADFESVDDYASNKISVLEQPRMPWHDVRSHLCQFGYHGVSDCGSISAT